MALNNYLSKPVKPVQSPNFQLKELQHNGFNPIHQQRVAKDFQVQKPKTSFKAPQASASEGSPWLSMGMQNGIK